MKIKKLFIGSGLMILAAVAVLPMLVGAAPGFPPPTGVPNATFSTVKTGKLDVEVSSGGAAEIGDSSNSATGSYSVALGYQNSATGSASIAMGTGNTASSGFSIAMGEGTVANGGAATAMGRYTTASGEGAFSSGFATSASGAHSVATGYLSQATGVRSTAMGQSTLASGAFSNAFNVGTTAQAYASTVIGQYNLVSGNTGFWAGSDPVFVVGNGASSVARSNALTVLQNGRVGIGTASPSSGLHIKGSNHPSSFLYLDTYADGADSGIRLMEGGWPKHHIYNRSADDALLLMANQFTQGIVIAQNGNVGIGPHYPAYKLDVGGDTRISGKLSVVVTAGGGATIGSSSNSATGLYAVAMGNASSATGARSLAIGNSTSATNSDAIAIGTSAFATGLYAHSFGYQSLASGQQSTSIGSDTVASGILATAIGNHTTAQAYQSTVVGSNNVISGNTTTWVTTDPIFVVGNGSSTASLSNAVTVLKNGNVGIGSNTPTNKLHVLGNTYIGGSITTNSGVYAQALDATNGVRATNYILSEGSITSYGNITANGQLTSYGNVGAGTGFPSARVHGTGSSYGVWGDGSTMGGRFHDSDGTSYSYLAYGGYSLYGNGNIYVGGNVGVGMAPSYKLDVAGDIRTNGWLRPTMGLTTSGSVYTGAVVSESSIYAHTDLMANGNVGAGTASPVYKLDVAGTANLNKGLTGVALRVNGAEALWDNGTYYSWGFGRTYNYFARNTFIGPNYSNPGYTLVVNGTAAKPGGGSWAIYSDVRLKDVKGKYAKGLNEILELNPVIFNYKKDNERNLPSDKEYVGFIAQDVRSVFPEAVGEDDEGYLDFDFHSIHVAVINAIKELKQEKDSEVAELKAELAELKELVCETKSSADYCAQ